MESLVEAVAALRAERPDRTAKMLHCLLKAERPGLTLSDVQAASKLSKRSAVPTRAPPAEAGASTARSAPSDEDFWNLVNQSKPFIMANKRQGYLAGIGKLKEASALADLIGGAVGSSLRAKADYLQTFSQNRFDDQKAAARVACSSLRAARAAGSRAHLVEALVGCGTVEAPCEMIKAEKESREQEIRDGHPMHDLDLSQEVKPSARSVALLRFLTPHAQSLTQTRFFLTVASSCRPPRPASPGCTSHFWRPRSASTTLRSQLLEVTVTAVPPHMTPPNPTTGSSRRTWRLRHELASRPAFTIWAWKSSAA